MSKINKLLKAVSLILKQPSLLNKVMDDIDVNKQEVIARHERFEDSLKQYAMLLPVGSELRKEFYNYAHQVFT